MNREDIRKLLGGYATDSLTPEEREALFTAALQDQTLFDELMREEALREVLRDPAGRAELLGVLDRRPQPWYRLLGWRSAAAAGVAFAVLAIGVFVTRPKPATMAGLRLPALFPELRERVPSSATRGILRPGAQPTPPPPASPEPRRGLGPTQASPKTVLEPQQPATGLLARQEQAASEVQSQPGVPQTQRPQEAIETRQPAASQTQPPRTGFEAQQQPSAAQTQPQPGVFQTRRQQAETEARPQQPALPAAPQAKQQAAASAVVADAGEAKGEAKNDSKDQRASAANAVGALARSADKKVVQASPAAVSRMTSLSKAETVRPAVRVSILRRDASGQFQETVSATQIRAGDTLRIVLEASGPGYLYVLERDPARRWQPRETALVQDGALFPIVRAYPEPGRQELYVVLNPRPLIGIASLDPLPEGTPITLTVR